MSGVDHRGVVQGVVIKQLVVVIVVLSGTVSTIRVSGWKTIRHNLERNFTLKRKRMI